MTEQTTTIPSSTYRLQLTKDFTFGDTVKILPYLQDLGISHLYLSPIFESTPGSTHGYDVMDFAKISVERGGADGFDALVKEAEKLGLGIILDIVPNHMSSSPPNIYWRDVLKNGRKSKYWKLFDLRIEDGEKIELPVLGESFDDILSGNKIEVQPHATEKFHLVCQDASYPLCTEVMENLSIPANPEQLKDIVEKQNYKFVHWTKASRKISYRRFFNITELIGVRVEDDEIFELTHRSLFDLLEKYPAISGVRVDHIDGLADPTAYLDKLRAQVPHIWVEKILSFEENLLPQWPIKGTTGYEFIARVNELMVNPEGFKKIREFWLKEVFSKWPSFDACVEDSKKEALENLFSFEMKRLVNLSQGGDSQDFWTDLSIALPVYRTYWDENGFQKSDLQWLEDAATKAGVDRNNSHFKTLLSPQNEKQRQAIVEWQQLSGPAMAKGLEDTAHYRFTPLAALNEVGCEGDLKNASPAQFFDWLNARAQNFPHCMNATSTHDTKRAEDVRHRLYALSHMPDDWIAFYREFRVQASPHLQKDKAIEYLVLQAIIGAWPEDDKIDDIFIDRIKAYATKAMKEAKLFTSWTDPDQSYEDAVSKFIDGVLRDKNLCIWISDFAQKISNAGFLNSLAVQTLKILSPGVPDIYNGTEGLDLSLVDPDNRRPVDYKIRATALQSQDDNKSAIKTRLTRDLLSIRKKYFAPGEKLETAYIETKNTNWLIYKLFSPSENLLIVLPRGQAQNMLDVDALLPVNKNIQYENLLLHQSQDFPIAILREIKNAN